MEIKATNNDLKPETKFYTVNQLTKFADLATLWVEKKLVLASIQNKSDYKNPKHPGNPENECYPIYKAINDILSQLHKAEQSIRALTNQKSAAINELRNKMSNSHKYGYSQETLTIIFQPPQGQQPQPPQQQTIIKDYQYHDFIDKDDVSATELYQKYKEEEKAMVEKIQKEEDELRNASLEIVPSYINAIGVKYDWSSNIPFYEACIGLILRDPANNSGMKAVPEES